MTNIEKDIRNKLYFKLLKIVNNLIGKNIKIKEIINYYKHNNNFKNLLKDINYIGIELLNNNTEEYNIIVRNLLNEILNDKLAIESDNKIKKIKDF